MIDYFKVMVDLIAESYEKRMWPAYNEEIEKFLNAAVQDFCVEHPCRVNVWATIEDILNDSTFKKRSYAQRAVWLRKLLQSKSKDVMIVA